MQGQQSSCQWLSWFLNISVYSDDFGSRTASDYLYADS